MLQLPDPQLTSPCNTHPPSAPWQTNGPPESPWQPLRGFPGPNPAQIIWSVIGIPVLAVFKAVHTDLETTGSGDCCRILCEFPGCRILPHPVNKIVSEDLKSQFLYFEKYLMEISRNV